MLRALLIVGAVVLATGNLVAQEAPPNPRVIIETSVGQITCELIRGDAPVSVVNFLTYVQEGYYTGTIFHRVIRDFMVQGGGYTEDLNPKLEGLRGGILNEATNNRQNRNGTLAMARLPAPHSARAQFFINTTNNDSLNHRNATDQGFGYAVFGRVTDGMDVVRKIERTRTHTVDGRRDVPRDPIVIKQIRRLD